MWKSSSETRPVCGARLLSHGTLAVAEVTERKRAVEARYGRLFETANDGILIVHATMGTVTDVNQRVLHLFGKQAEQVMGRHFWDVMPVSLRPKGGGFSRGYAVGRWPVQRRDSMWMVSTGSSSPLPKFTVFLPPAERQPVPGRGSTIWRSDGHWDSILVDDEEDVVAMDSSILSTHGYEVLTAHNGSAAPAILNQRHREVSCVLLDLTMPVMSGEETLTAIRER